MSLSALSDELTRVRTGKKEFFEALFGGAITQNLKKK